MERNVSICCNVVIMRVRQYLDLLGIPKLIEILRVFSRNNTQYTGRQIAKEIGLNHVSATKALHTLVEYEILNMTAAGNSHLYTINDSYYVREVLLPLLYKETDLFERIKKEILTTFDSVCSHICIFGSYAAGDEHDDSDLDVFFIGEDNEAFQTLFEILSDKIRKNYLLKVSPYFVLKKDLEKKKKLKLFENIKKESIWLKGGVFAIAKCDRKSIFKI